MAKKRMANGSETSDVQSIAEIIAKSEGEILERWMVALKSKITLREDLLTEADLRKRSAEFLRSLKVGLRRGDVADVDADAWQPLKALLRDIFAAHSANGVNPSEAAFYVFALKDTLAEFFQKDAGERPASFKRHLDLLAHLLEQLGLYAFEAVTQSCADGPSKGRQRALPAAGGPGDTPDAAGRRLLSGEGEAAARDPPTSRKKSKPPPPFQPINSEIPDRSPSTARASRFAQCVMA